MKNASVTDSTLKLGNTDIKDKTNVRRMYRQCSGYLIDHLTTIRVQIWLESKFLQENCSTWVRKRIRKHIRYRIRIRHGQNESKIRSLADPHSGEKWKEVFM
jgi:hypothetical protein